MRAKLPREEGFVERAGVAIHYEIYGDVDETILFIPLWSITHSRVYKAQVPYFSEHFRCVTYDPRGNGMSDRPKARGAYALENFVDDALAVMDGTKTKTAILYGLSAGAIFGAVLAAYYPERIRALLTVGGACLIAPDPPYRTNESFAADRDSYEGWGKWNHRYWRTNYPDFVAFLEKQIHNEPHSTRQQEEAVSWALQTDGETLVRTRQDGASDKYRYDEEMYGRIRCPVLAIHGGNDVMVLRESSVKIAALTKGELVIMEGAGHVPLARYPAKTNLLVRDFLARKLDTWSPAKVSPRAARSPKSVLYLSSPIGLGHGRRDLAVARELRTKHPSLQIDWLAQDPVTRLLIASGENIHPARNRLAGESAHIESEAGEHDLHVFQSVRRMDEILLFNFMIFQEAIEQGEYDLVIADEAWEVDHFWHEHPELKRTRLAWLTDYVGYVPMEDGGAEEAFLSRDYNAEMIEHVERHPGVRDRAIFVGNAEDIVPLSFGDGLPDMRAWIPEHFEFSGYILGQHPAEFGTREALRARFGYGDNESVCVVAVGGSGVGLPLIKRVVSSYPIAKKRLPNLRLIIVCGPRIDPANVPSRDGIEVSAFVTDLDRRLAACDLALVQGGLATCMELTAANVPFIYFPLRHHFEQNFHVAYRLDRYGAGIRMDYGDSDPHRIADIMVEAIRKPVAFTSVEANGAKLAAEMLADLL